MTKTTCLMRKPQLQSYAQINNLDQPVFTFKVEGLPHVIFYKATIVIGGTSFDNQIFFNTRKEAEHATRFNFFSDEQLWKHSVRERVRREDIKDVSLRVTAKRDVEEAFRKSLKTVKQSLEDYTSPIFRGDHNKAEAIQRLNLHKASTIWSSCCYSSLYIKSFT
ncbi:hypothetical protein RYX36_016584 [Vicia faba]